MEKLELKQYIERLYRVAGREDEADKEIRNPSKTILEMYKEYLTGEMKSFRINEDRTRVKLTDIAYLTSYKPVFGSTAEFWFVRSDLRPYLLKENTPIFDSYGNSFKTETNCMLLPEFVQQFDLSSARYYLVSYYDYEGQEETFIVTPDFKEDEFTELISGDTLVSSEMDKVAGGCLNIREMINRIVQALSLRRFSKGEIEQVRKDFLKQCYFYKFADSQDENNHNWGIVINGDHVKLAPLYDYEYCFGNKRIAPTQRYVADNKTDLESLVLEFQDEEWFINWVENLINNLDLEKALTQAEESTNFIFENEVRIGYQDKINYKIKETQETLQKVRELKNRKGEER